MKLFFWFNERFWIDNPILWRFLDRYTSRWVQSVGKTIRWVLSDLFPKFIYNGSCKNQGKLHTLLRLSQCTLLNLQKILVGLDIFRKLLFNDDSHKNQGGIIGKTMTQNTTKNFTNRSNVTQNTTHWKLIWRRTYIPDPALPANAPASENKRSADDFGGRKNWQRLMDGGWLKAIDRFYCRNSVGLISAKYCSDAKWYTRHGGVIFSPSHSFAEKGKMLPLTYDDDLSGWSFFCQNHGLPFFVYYG